MNRGGRPPDRRQTEPNAGCGPKERRPHQSGSRPRQQCPEQPDHPRKGAEPPEDGPRQGSQRGKPKGRRQPPGRQPPAGAGQRGQTNQPPKRRRKQRESRGQGEPKQRGRQAGKKRKEGSGNQTDRRDHSIFFAAVTRSASANRDVSRCDEGAEP